MHIPVIIVHPLDINKSFKRDKSLISTIIFVDKYVIIIIGKTISLAGNPNIKAVTITPSNPINKPNGFKKFDNIFIIFLPPISILVNSQISSPVGAAIITALPSIFKVLSTKDLTNTFNI